MLAGRSAIRGAATRAAGYVAGSLLGVVSAAVVLRHLGPDGFGRYATVFALLAVVMAVAEAGTANIAVREHALASPDERARLLANVLGVRLAVAVVGVVIAVAFALAAPYDGAMVLGTVLAGGGLVVTVVALTYSIPLQADMRLGRVTALELIRQAATVVALLVLVALGAGLAPLLGAPIPAGVVLLGFAVVLAGGSGPARVAFDRDRWRSLLGDTLPYTAATAVGVLYSYVTVVMTSLVATSEQTGYLGAAHRIWFVLTALPGLLVASVFPLLVRAAHGNDARFTSVVQRTFDVQLAVGAGLALVVATGAPVAIDVVAGSGYAPAIPVLRLQAVALAATALAALGGFALLTLGRHRALLGANTFALVVTAALTAVLASSDGARGAAVALIVGEVLVASTYFALLARGGARPGVTRAPRILLATGLGAVPGFALGLPALPAAIAAGLVYVLAALALHAVPDEVVAALRS